MSCFSFEFFNVSGNTFNRVIVRSQQEWFHQYAKTVITLERAFPKEQLVKFQREYTQELTKETFDCRYVKGVSRSLVLTTVTSEAFQFTFTYMTFFIADIKSFGLAFYFYTLVIAPRICFEPYVQVNMMNTITAIS